ncbi:MAG: hypothetical protein Fur0032_12480 [Terrimicrobiaceae bacterium]
MAPGADAFGLEVIDGAVDTVDAAVSCVEETLGAVLTIPFLGGSKVVWLKSAGFLADSVTGRSESVASAMDKLCDVIERGIPDGVSLLISAPQADKRRTAYRRLAKLCQTEVIDMPDLGFRAGEEGLIEWVVGQAHAKGLKLGRGAAEVLASRVGLVPAQIHSELEKLETAFGKTAEIPAAEVRLLVPQTREGGIFDLSGAILQRDAALALDTLAQLYHQGEKGVGILLAAIVPTVRNLLLVKDLMGRYKISPPTYPNQFTAALSRLPATATAHLPRKKDGNLNTYPLGLAAASASHFTLAELEEGFRSCAEAAQALFGGGAADDVVIARLLLGLLSRHHA